MINRREFISALGAAGLVSTTASGAGALIKPPRLRPGDTVSGPSLFTLADIGGYVCVLSHAGPDALSLTTNLNINFVRL